MKTFTLAEANEELAGLSTQLGKLKRLYEYVDELQNEAVAAASASEHGGGMVGGTAYVKALYDIGVITTDIDSKGIQIKDCRSGLVDFPSMREGRIVLLCWRLGEDPYIEWWHETDTGFAGRKPI